MAVIEKNLLKCMGCNCCFDISAVPEGFKPLCPKCKSVKDYVHPNREIQYREQEKQKRQAYNVKTTTSASAVCSLVLGIVGIFLYFLPIGFIAVILGWIALYKIKHDEYLDGRGMAIAGIVTGAISALIFIAMVVFFVFIFSLMPK